jgi:hypothetical protein
MILNHNIKIYYFTETFCLYIILLFIWIIAQFFREMPLAPETTQAHNYCEKGD